MPFSSESFHRFYENGHFILLLSVLAGQNRDILYESGMKLQQMAQIFNCVYSRCQTRLKISANTVFTRV